MNMIESDWTWLNMMECTWVLMNTFEWASNMMNVIEHAWVHMDAVEWVWTYLYYWFLHEIECAWMPLSECEHEWMNLKMAWVLMNAFEQVFKHAWTCLSTYECLWVSVESDGCWLNVIWLCMNALESIEHMWVSNQFKLKKINRASSNWIWE